MPCRVWGGKDKYMKKSAVISVILIIIISAAAGSIYMMLCSSGDDIHNYINEFLWNLKSGARSKNIFLNSCKDSMLTLAVITVCAFLRFGFVISLFTMARRCFIACFTSAAFIAYSGGMSVLKAAIISLPFMMSLPALAAVCSVSVSMSVQPRDTARIRSYIVLTAGAAVLLTASALAEGYLVTIIMNAVS